MRQFYCLADQSMDRDGTASFMKAAYDREFISSGSLKCGDCTVIMADQATDRDGVVVSAEASGLKWIVL